MGSAGGEATTSNIGFGPGEALGSSEALTRLNERRAWCWPYLYPTDPVLGACLARLGGGQPGTSGRGGVLSGAPPYSYW